MTELRVVVHSDLRVPEELSSMRARVTPLGEGEPITHTFALGSEGAQSLPLSFSILPAAGDAEGELRLQVEAVGDGKLKVSRSIRTGFIAGRRLSLPVFLMRACMEPNCDPDMTCDQGSCIDEHIDPRSLEQIVAGQDPRPMLPAAVVRDDAGAGDDTSGVMDASSADSGPSQPGIPDAGDAGGAEAGAGSDPTQQLSCGGSCSCASDARCVIDAVGGDATEITCEPGSQCSVDGRGSRRLMVHCEPGARCDVDCDDSTSCMLDCAAAACRLQCQGAHNCRIHDCPSDPLSCPDGAAVCGRDC